MKKTSPALAKKPRSTRKNQPSTPWNYRSLAGFFARVFYANRVHLCGLMDGLSRENGIGKLKAAALSEALLKAETFLECFDAGQIDTRTTLVERAFIVHGNELDQLTPTSWAKFKKN